MISLIHKLTQVHKESMEILCVCHKGGTHFLRDVYGKLPNYSGSLKAAV